MAKYIFSFWGELKSKCKWDWNYIIGMNRVFEWRHLERLTVLDRLSFVAKERIV